MSKLSLFATSKAATVCYVVLTTLFGAAGLSASCMTDTADPGCVHFAQRTDSSYDQYINGSTSTQQWLKAHLWRMETTPGWFDNNLSWYSGAWAYFDSYAIYNDGSVQSHPEWILHDQNGNQLYIPWGCNGGTCPQFAADIANPDYRANWISQATAMIQAGYKGLWIDDVNLPMNVSDGNGNLVAPIDRNTGQPMTQTAWEKYFADFMTQIRVALPNAEIVHNSVWYAGSGEPGTDPYVQQEIKAANYINRESGVSDGGLTGDNGYWSLQSFFRFVDIVHSLGTNIDIEEFDFSGDYAPASYFLVSQGKDTLGNMAANPTNWTPVYDVSLGSPIAARYVWNGLIRRDFVNGLVLVNPPNQPTVTVTLPQTYKDSQGNLVSSITLSAKQGAVLTPYVASATAVRINVCGPVTGSFGADFGAISGHCDTTTSSIDLSKANSPAPMNLYQSKRTTNWGARSFGYTVSGLIPGYSYQVRLHFADDVSRRAGQRVFNVLVNGQTVLKNFDIYKLAGAPLTAVVMEAGRWTANAHGIISITYQNGSAGNALASGISVLP